MFFYLTGRRLYGKVDRVPGLFFVATAFAFINYFPLVPLRSYLVLDTDHERGVRLPIQGKSVWTAYLRAVGIVLAPISLLLAGLLSPLLMLPQFPGFRLGWAIWVGVSGALFLFALATLVGRPIGRERAVALAERAGLDPTFVHEHFDWLVADDDSEPPRLDRRFKNALEYWAPESRSTDFHE